MHLRLVHTQRTPYFDVGSIYINSFWQWVTQMLGVNGALVHFLTCLECSSYA